MKNGSTTFYASGLKPTDKPGLPAGIGLLVSYYELRKPGSPARRKFKRLAKNNRPRPTTRKETRK